MPKAVAAVAENLFDAPRLVVELRMTSSILRHLLQPIELIVEKRPVENRHDGLGVCGW
jgi:hypothetical protein